MTTLLSAPFVDPRTNTAVLTMSYDGEAIGPVTYENFVVTIPARPQITTQLHGLEWFVNEAWYWVSLIENRLETKPDARDYRNAVEPKITLTETYVDPPGPTPPYWRVDGVHMDALIYTAEATPTTIELTYTAPDTVVLAARPQSRLAWQDWRNFVIANQQFLHFCLTGGRNGEDIA